MNKLMGDSNQPVPVVGMGATILAWTDRYAGTVVAVTPKSFTVREDTATRTDANGMSEVQSYDYTPNPNGRTWTFRMTKRGWSAKGTGVALGFRRAYHDYSF
jgi:hypothetical protein